MITAEPLWGELEGGLVYIATDGEVCPNGNTWQMEPVKVVAASHLADEILRAARQALIWEVTEGEG